MKKVDEAKLRLLSRQLVACFPGSANEDGKAIGMTPRCYLLLHLVHTRWSIDQISDSNASILVLEDRDKFVPADLV